MSDIFEKLLERRIVGIGAINEKSAQAIEKALLELSLAAPEKEIRLSIDSGGGSVPSALSICDLIKCLKTPVIGIVVGDCMSMAVTILQSCHERLALRHARFLLHFVSTSFEFSHNLSDAEIHKLFERRFVEGRRAQAQNEQFLSSRTGKTVEEIRALMLEGDKVDARLSVEDALALGLVDHVIEDPSGLYEAEWSSRGKLFPKEES